MSIRLLAVILLGFVGFSCGEAPDVANETQTQRLTPATLPAGEGTYKLSFGPGGILARKYWVYVPPSWPNGGPYRAIFNFHGAGASNYHTTTANQDLVDRARAGNVILFFPLGLLKTWNAGHCCLGNPADDVGFVSDLVAEMETEFSLDTDQVYAMGHSNGGMLVQRIAAEMPDLFAAYASVNGSVGSWSSTTLSAAPGCDPTDAACVGWEPLWVQTPTAPVDIMMVESKLDTVVPYDGGLNEDGVGLIWYLPAIPDPGYSTSTWEVWEATNGCAGPVITNFGAGERWRCSGAADLKMAHIDIGSHEWPELTTGTYDANKHIIDFFLAHPR